MQYAQLRDTLRGYWPGGQLNVSDVIWLSLSEAYRGGRRVIERDGRRIVITIPPGVHTGARLYLPRLESGSARDAEFCSIVVHDAPPFKRCGNDLQRDFSIDAYTAILGGQVVVPTLFGQCLLTVPPGTSPGTILRVPGQGMPVMGNPLQHGDLCVHILVAIRAGATDLERKLIADSAWLRGWHLRGSAILHH